jgi:DNA-binding NarL/FixJ family response regulator
MHISDGNSISILAEIKNITRNQDSYFYRIDEDSNALKYIKAGANGFLSKMSEEEEIKSYFKNASRWRIYFGYYASFIVEFYEKPKVD